ncbi:RNA-binding S4 domain-containing protein [Liquorilactobacillus uvarum]|uniref:RNA-binding S4 domain-containing protein n=1 Tax=Liquorilactobacillus uvarum TaxID=303240 RepID=UPI00288A1C43|nr:RNA-binding S4 domain-containing protein [Liquorilactobacillus uvarum]
MRIDKFLKISRIVKRRTVAKQITDKGRIKINDKVAKSSSNVAQGDVITIGFGNKTLKIKVNSIKENAKKDEAGQMYDILAENYKENFNN